MRKTLYPPNFGDVTEQKPQNSYVITSAYRTLQVLQAFAAAPHRFGLTELVNRMGLEKNQLYRSLKTLEQAVSSKQMMTAVSRSRPSCTSSARRACIGSGSRLSASPSPIWTRW